MVKTIIVAFVILCASSASAGNLKLPTAALILAQTADIVSTHHALQSGAREGNVIMQGSNAKRAAIKAATTTGIVLLMQKVEKSHPKLAKGMLYGMAGIVGGIAVHNARLK